MSTEYELRVRNVPSNERACSEARALFDGLDGMLNGAAAKK
jgi:hypothetical protein